MSLIVTDPTNAIVLPYAEIALDVATWDLVVPKTILRGSAAIVQRLRVRIGFWFGEYFLDKTQGVPYLQVVFVKNPKPPPIVAMFRKVIASTPGIMAVPLCVLGPLDGPTRSATVSFVGQLENGSQIRAVNEPFRILGVGS